MTRLADALERAKRAPDPAAPQRAQARPAAPAPGGQPHVHRPQAAAAVAARNTAPAAPQAANATPLLGMPDEGHINSAWRTDPQLVGKLLGTDGFSGAALEQYRKLAATLHHAQGERGIRVIMTASALPGEGKSLTAV